MNFSTKRAGKKRPSWRDAQDEPTSKKQAPSNREAGEDASDDEGDAFEALKRDLATRERIKAQRKKQLDKEASIIARTRGEDTERKPGVHVWLDVTIPKRSTHDAGKGRLIFELFEDVVPRTCKNFCQLITGEKGDGLRYEGSAFFRVEPGKGVCGGDIDKNDGTGGRSVYGRDYEDENHRLKHTNAGVLTTLTKRPNANQSQFEILLDERPELDGRRVVFGSCRDTATQR